MKKFIKPSIKETRELFSKEELNQYKIELRQLLGSKEEYDPKDFPFLRMIYSHQMYGLKREDWIREEEGHYSPSIEGSDKINQYMDFDSEVILSFGEWLDEFYHSCKPKVVRK